MIINKILRNYYLLRLDLIKSSFSREDRFLIEKIIEKIFDFDNSTIQLFKNDENVLCFTVNFRLANSTSQYQVRSNEISMDNLLLFENRRVAIALCRLAKNCHDYFKNNYVKIKEEKEIDNSISTFPLPKTECPPVTMKYLHLLGALGLTSFGKNKIIKDFLNNIALAAINNHLDIELCSGENSNLLAEKTFVLCPLLPDGLPDKKYRLTLSSSTRDRSLHPSKKFRKIFINNKEILSDLKICNSLARILNKKCLENKQIKLASRRKEVVESGPLSQEWSAQLIDESIAPCPPTVNKNKI